MKHRAASFFATAELLAYVTDVVCGQFDIGIYCTLYTTQLQPMMFAMCDELNDAHTHIFINRYKHIYYHRCSVVRWTDDRKVAGLTAGHRPTNNPAQVAHTPISIIYRIHRRHQRQFGI